MQQIIWAFWNDQQKRLRAGWRLLVHLISTVVFTIVVMIVVMSVTSFFLSPDESDPLFMAIGAVLQNVVVLAVVIVACVFIDRRRVRDLGLHLDRRWWLDLLGGLALGAGLMGIIFAIEYQQGWITLASAETTVDWGRMLKLQVCWIIAMTFVGFGEEILSRGYHLKNLTEGFQRLGFLTSFMLAALIGSSVFGILHALNPNATLVATLAIMLAGIMFCVGRICTGSLAAPIGMHIAWNYFQGAVFGFPVSGQKLEGSLIEIDSTIDSVWTGGEFGPENSLLGLIAIAIAILVFAFWPKKKSNWKENLVELVRFRRRVPISKKPRIEPVDAQA